MDATPTTSPFWSARPAPSLMHAQLLRRPPLATSASGLTIHLEGRGAITDATGGATAAIIGHGNAEVLAAVTAQMQQLSYCHTLCYTTAAAEALADRLVAGAGAGFADGGRAYLVCSGSEAVDSAMKLARQRFYEAGEPRRTHYIARRQAYHGNTLGAMSLTAAPARVEPYRDIFLPAVSHVAPCYAYQYRRPAETDAAYVARLAEELDAEFRRIGPERVVAFVGETVSGSVAGCVPPVDGYWRAMKAVCERHGALLILDEVMCGMGRTGSMFAWQREGVVPDITTVGKGLGGGYIPIAAVLAQGHVMDVLERGSGNVVQSYTFQAHAVASAAALAVQNIVQRDGLIENSARMGVVLEELLRSALAEKMFVGNIRGRGCFYAVEFVKDKSTKESLDPALKFAYMLAERALDMGVHLYPMSGTVDGKRGDHILLAPAITVTEEQLRGIVGVVKAAYDEVEAEVLRMHC
ncbi:putative acetylornithine aminotransferase protein [Neofusicoccum parvum UCRNP2]|uniref:Putative acetylornithine aminotransferase protein n=1 Tax=Botryosphaeria parva (strain UCR-NP2) TaxID=1287680 RepID=R1GUM1_BOTPV|nr:putative acetylornithine aminotransferase protein [Neofusicoccum parvum UCRNP2]